MSLRQKIILLIVPIIVVPMMISGWVSYSQLNETAIEKSKEQMETLLEQYALYADSLIHSAESNVRLVSNNELLRRYMVTQSEEERYEILQPLLMKQLQSYQKTYPLYYELRLIMPDGFEDFRLVNRDIDNVTMNEADNPFVKQILSNKKGVFTRMTNNPDNGELALYVAIALNLKDRSIESVSFKPRFRGYLVLTIDISEVIRQMELSTLGSDGFLFTTNSKGQTGLYPERLAEVLRGERLSSAQMQGLEVDHTVLDVVGGVDLSMLPIIETHFLDNDGYMKGVKIHDDLILITWLPFNEINQQTQDLGITVISITLFAVLVTVLLLFSSLNHFVLNPIQKLRSAANEIGQGVLTTAIDMKQNDEVGDLAKSFDDMRKNMMRSHEHLEGLVDERTMEVRKALETAEKSSQAKSNFLSRMSHELRTPLNAILGFSQLYEYDYNLTGHQKMNAREINNAGEHLLSLVDEVLDLSKIEAGRLELSMETISLLNVLDNCCLLTESLAKAHGISIEFDREHCDELYVHADYIRVKQVFLNLLSNAVKYNQENGKVSVYCEKNEDNAIRINIKDTGPGIPADNMPLIFEPFNRLGAEYSETEGTGIGLVITSQLVELMGGMLGIDSEPGMGSTFYVDLAASSETEIKSVVKYRREPIPVSTLRKVPADHARILVAEDNETNQEVLRQQLGLLGYSADFVNNGAVALEKWRTGDYHLLLTDIHMPKMDGYELVDNIRKSQQYAETRLPLIAITADAMQGQAQRCLDAGMDDYVAKPVHMEELQGVLNKWLPKQAADKIDDDTEAVNSKKQTIKKNAANIYSTDTIDRRMLTRMVGDDPVTHRRLLQSFLRSTPEIIEQIQVAVSQSDADVIVAQTHKLKSSARSMGANELSDTCQLLEVAARNKQWKEAEDHMSSIDGLFLAVERYVEESFTLD